MKTPSPASRCPACAKRGALRDFQGVQDAWDRFAIVTWQCVYCGAVCEPVLRKWIICGYAPIILAPGELEALRASRGRARTP